MLHDGSKPTRENQQWPFRRETYLDFSIPEGFEIRITKYGRHNEGPMQRRIGIHWTGNLLKLALNCYCLLCVITHHTAPINSIKDLRLVLNHCNEL
jgi:hypothetical protein